MEKILHINDDNFEKEILQSEVPVLVDFWAEWCGPCKMLAPVFEEVAGEINNVKFAKVNVDEAGELAHKFRIMSIPTLVLMKDGKPVKKSVGLISKNDMIDLLK